MLKKIYDKNELWFSLLFIIIYCETTIPIRGELGDGSVFMLISTLFISILTIAFVKKYKLEDKYGLNRLPKNIKRYLYFAPLIILGTCNFWGGFKQQHEGIALIYALLSMILIGWIEEIIFRGFLLKKKEKRRGLKVAIIISSVTFGIGHILNLVSQPGFETFLQVIYAIAFGFMFVYVFLKTKSLWPCIILHSIIDFTAMLQGDNMNTIVTTIIITIICIIYTLYLKRIKD